MVWGRRTGCDGDHGADGIAGRPEVELVQGVVDDDGVADGRDGGGEGNDGDVGSTHLG